MVIYVYARQTLRAGDRAPEPDRETDDLVRYDGNCGEFKTLAASAREAAKHAGAGADLYYRRLARTLAAAAEEAAHVG